MKKDVKPDVVELINKMRQEVAAIDRKIDILISRSSPKPVEIKPFHKPFQQYDRAHGHSGGREGNSYGQRVLHKAICADCKKGCEVPFRPSGERPVYCKECFSKRKRAGPFKARPDNRPRESAPAQAVHADKPQDVEKKKSIKKKKPAVKRRK